MSATAGLASRRGFRRARCGFGARRNARRASKSRAPRLQTPSHFVRRLRSAASQMINPTKAFARRACATPRGRRDLVSSWTGVGVADALLVSRPQTIVTLATTKGPKGFCTYPLIHFWSLYLRACRPRTPLSARFWSWAAAKLSATSASANARLDDFDQFQGRCVWIWACLFCGFEGEGDTNRMLGVPVALGGFQAPSKLHYLDASFHSGRGSPFPAVHSSSS